MTRSKLVKSLEDVNGVRSVKKIQFGIFDPELIKKGSVVEVTVGEAYSNDEPVANGVFDSRMGVTDVGRECTTCYQQLDLCPGHFGHIQLALPIFIHHFVPSVVEVLRCVCFRCSNILIDKSDPIIMENLRKFTPDKRIKYLKGLCDKITKCRTENCSMPKPKFYNLSSKSGKKDAKSIVSIFAEFSSEVVKDKNVDPTISITALTCYMIMKKISDEDIELLGFSPTHSRPEWMICNVIPVPPPAVRPSVRNGNQQMSDDLTYSLITIVKTNAKLKEKIESGDRKQIDGFHAALQHSFSMYQNNDKAVGPLVTHRSGRPLKGLSQRWKEKTGRMRGNLMGKRLNKTARTVADVGVNISIDEFGVPEEIAMNLTYPEIVTPYNIKQMYLHVRNGPAKYPGAKYVVKYEGNCFGEQVPCKLTLAVLDLNKIELNIGDIVHRHLLNGDYCLFNRQPTLHRMSMMAHRIRITKHQTFKLNVFTTEPYNADFDGDELNMHVPQSIRSATELKNIASVNHQIISPAQCRPIIKIKQDSVVGAYLMTSPDTLIEEGEFMNLMVTNSEFNGVLPDPAKIVDGVSYWTGHQLFSTILPDITIDVGNDQNETIRVVSGEITEGRVDSKVLDRLIHPIHNLFNSEVARRFLDNAQNLLTKWMINCGFSISFGESLPPRSLIVEIDKTVDVGMERVNEKIRLAQQGLFYPELSDELRYEVFEAEMIKMLGEVSNEVSKMVKNYLISQPDNAYYQSIASGAKGKWDNAMQVMGVIGQQEIWKKRVQKSFTNRSEPHFSKYDESPYSRGYCRNSFIRGMSPQEFFFHMMGGRVGLIDTAINTALVGYITRRMIKSMEDLTVKYDATVRNANGKIVCFKYGGDGFDPIKLEADSINLLQYDDQMMMKTYRFSQSDKKDWLQIITKKTVTEMFKKSSDAALLKTKLDAEFNQLMKDREQLRTKFFPYRDNALTVPDLFMPFKIGRLAKHVTGMFGLNGSQISDLNPIYIIDKVTELINHIVAYMQEKDTALTLIKIQIRSQLSSKQCITQFKLTRECFDYLIENLKTKVYEAFISPGEMVGCIAGQSAGEPVLQMVLNSFHFSGLGARTASVTQGAPRIEEIIIATKTMKTPSATIYLKEEYRYNAEKAEELRAALEYTQLSDLVLKTEIIYEHENAVLNDDEDLAFVQMTNEFNEILGLDQGADYSPSILRIEFDRESMLYKNMTMSEIQENILRTGSLEEYIHSAVSDDNSQNLVMRLRIKENDGTESRIDFIEELKKELLKVKLRGVPGIRTVGRTEQSIVVYTPDGKSEVRKEQILITTGTNLAEILTYDIVDIERTTSNDIHEILSLFGIKATRQKIYEELRAVYSGAGIELNSRHMQLISDNMTYSGRLLPMSRYGVPNRSEDSGPIAKASNEEISDSLIKAARFHEEDNMKGTSVNIMMGQFVPAGTSAFELVLDENILKNNINKTQEQRKIMTSHVDVKSINLKLDDLHKDEDAANFIFDENFDENIVEPDAFSATKIEPQVEFVLNDSAGKKIAPRAKRVRKV